eukprot:71227_1
MGSSRGHLLLSILFAFYHLNAVFGSDYVSRTCICAEFTPDECDEHMLCKWNANTAHQGDQFGLCRSLRWYTCHVDPDCTTKGYLEQTEIDEDLMRDWPWNCQTFQYESSPVNVQQYQLAASNIQIQSKQSFIPQSLENGNVLGFVPILVLICVAIYYAKKRRDSHYKSIDLMETETSNYGTLP